MLFGSRSARFVGRLVAMLIAVCAPLSAHAQSHVDPHIENPLTLRVERAFPLAEHAEYSVSYGIIHAGTATLSVLGIDTVRNHDAYRFRLTFDAGVNLLLVRYHARDTMQSWVDTATFHSLRFNQDQVDGGRKRTKRYEIFPDRAMYKDGTQPEQPSVSDPLDEIGFLFFVRGQSLDVGSRQEWTRYFKPGSNPVVLKVLGKDTIEVAGKRWPAVVVQPIIKTSRLFSDGEARVWLSDDPSRIVLQINTKLSIGSITMKLTSYQANSSATRVGNASQAGEPKPE